LGPCGQVSERIYKLVNFLQREESEGKDLNVDEGPAPVEDTAELPQPRVVVKTSCPKESNPMDELD
jgi:hypothetical protein